MVTTNWAKKPLNSLVVRSSQMSTKIKTVVKCAYNIWIIYLIHNHII